MSVLFRLPNGRSIPMQRAIRMGYADADGNPVVPAAGTQAANVLAKAAKAARKRRGVAQKVTASVTEVDAPETTEDGIIKRKRREPKPLVPQNVTPEGEPITDEAILAEIAAKTAAIEASRSTEEGG